MSSRPDYYSILEIARNASTDDIKKAYRRLALKYHPDKHAPEAKAEAEEKFKLISEAFSVLSDPQKRQQYDNPMPEHGTGTGAGGFSDFNGFSGFTPFSPFGSFGNRGSFGFQPFSFLDADRIFRSFFGNEDPFASPGAGMFGSSNMSSFSSMGAGMSGSSTSTSTSIDGSGRRVTKTVQTITKPDGTTQTTTVTRTQTADGKVQETKETKEGRVGDQLPGQGGFGMLPGFGGFFGSPFGRSPFPSLFGADPFFSEPFGASNQSRLMDAGYSPHQRALPSASHYRQPDQFEQSRYQQQQAEEYEMQRRRAIEQQNQREMELKEERERLQRRAQESAKSSSASRGHGSSSLRVNAAAASARSPTHRSGSGNSARSPMDLTGDDDSAVQQAIYSSLKDPVKPSRSASNGSASSRSGGSAFRSPTAASTTRLGRTSGRL